MEKPKRETTIATKPNANPKPQSLDELFEALIGDPEQMEFFAEEFRRQLFRRSN